MSELSDVDELAQFIRTTDGDHDMGTGALAEAIVDSDWLVKVKAEAAAEALEQAALVVDREIEQDCAASRVAEVRCFRCQLRYGECDQYGCIESGRGHEYDADELAEAAVLRIEPTYWGDQLRERADRRRRVSGIEVRDDRQ